MNTKSVASKFSAVFFLSICVSVFAFSAATSLFLLYWFGHHMHAKDMVSVKDLAGTVVMTWGNSSLMITKAWLWVFVFFFTAIASSSLFILLSRRFRRVILSPLHQLTFFMRNTDSLNPEEMIIHTNDEFQVLAENHNRLLRKLENVSRELSKLHEELDRRVAMRTGKLEETTRALQQDVDVFEKVQKELLEREDRYRKAFEAAPDSITMIRVADGKLIDVNEAFCKLIGLSKEKIIEKSLIDYIHPEERKMVLERYQKRISGKSFPDIYSFRLVTDFGKELWVELNDVLISWAGGPAILSFLRDITEQKKMELRVEKVQRMDSIGTLAGGIAHNFNNLLMGIQGNLSLILLDEEIFRRHGEELKSIERCIESGANLTKQLLGFARGGKYIVKLLDPNELVHNTSRMFGQSKREIKIHGSFQKNIWAVEADQGQIELVLLNIYVNAAQAMENGGDMYLKTENIVFGDSDAENLGIPAGKYVKISIADTGPGIDRKILDKIFEPFYTTKEIGQGTGLGLATAFGIVKSHGGFIGVETGENEGTQFDIFLPATEKKETAEDKPAEPIQKGTETILLIDDENMVINVCRSMLKELGYEVLVARGGKSAIEIYAGNKEKISLVILDIIMPDMDGEKVYDRIKEVNPEVKVLLSSGYSMDNKVSAIMAKGCDGFIQKPYKIKELASSVREIIGKGSNL